jgi:hypothetical protein
VKRLLKGLKRDNPEATVMLEFDPGEAAQVDFAKGPAVSTLQELPRGQPAAHGVGG